MELDISIHKGNPEMPVVIFIHGLAMDKNFWLDPLESKVFGKSVPMKVFGAAQPRPVHLPQSPACKLGVTIGNLPKKINNLWIALKDRGLNLVCWSQRRPVGPIADAVEELREVMEFAARAFPGKSIVLVCHSRGGLIARKFMEKKHKGIKALITVSTPHNGSSLSRLASHLSPLSAIIKAVLPSQTHGTISEVIQRTNDLIEGSALKELMPGSEFFENLRDEPVKGMEYLSFGGTKTKLVTVYKWKKKENITCPKPVVVVPDSLIKVFPSSIVPEEIKPGKGDFMVTAKSSVLPWAQKHYNVHANHISITWNKKVISSVLDLLEGI
jgi:pimeloyl-ACP methyl ester carboxylesterase